jgi:hypothetical protein
MRQIQIDNDLYRRVQRRAAEAGYGSVDEYVAARLRHDFEKTEDLDRFFTPERLAHIDRADAQIDAGQGIPAAQVREHFRQKRDG